MAPRNRARLTKGGPHSRSARDLLRAEYALRNRGRGGTGPADADGIWAQLVAELRRLLRTFTGGSRPAPGGAGPAPGGGQGGGQETRQGVGQGIGQGDGHGVPGSGQGVGRPDGSLGPGGPVPAGLALLEQRLLRLPAHEREAFEDAVLDLVRNNRKYRKAFEKSPESMPLVARCATNAYERELVREAPGAAVSPGSEPEERRQGEPARSRWERPAQNRGVPATTVPPSSGSGFGAPGPDEMTDGHGFEEAERVSLAERTTAATWSPRAESFVDGQGFLAAERAPRVERSERGERSEHDVRMERGTLSPAPSLLDLPGRAAPVSPLLDPAAPLSPLPGQAATVSPLLSRAVPASPPLGSAPVASPISGDGHQALNDSLGLFSRSPAPRSPNAPSRSGTFRPPPAAPNTSAPRSARHT
ncbi:hypothetical protein [Streptomyces sp. NPDC001914]|uniref:hypothetical protein n=1 Tax=Streptomyces sp. NPDC001914 TaxID=3364623 RepID=UPI0036CF29B2